ncbi:MAG: hypothetical protein GF311_11635 [Candidatus Lokiarchaeota archaeon]|nr:hypothetical protein [Candidatus Lokiarchaeota archaeon]
MKKRREIILTHPRLIKIRQNFQDPMFEEKTKRSIDLLDKKMELNCKTQEKEWDDLQKKYKELQNSLRKSIIICNSCGRREGDRMYRPEDAGWFCTRCDKKLGRIHYLEDQVKKHFTFDQIDEFLLSYGSYLIKTKNDVLTESLLDDTPIPIEFQQELVELIQYYGGLDPSEICLNAEPKLMKLFESEFEEEFGNF